MLGILWVWKRCISQTLHLSPLQRFSWGIQLGVYQVCAFHAPGNVLFRPPRNYAPLCSWEIVAVAGIITDAPRNRSSKFLPLDVVAPRVGRRHLAFKHKSVSKIGLLVNDVLNVSMPDYVSSATSSKIAPPPPQKNINSGFAKLCKKILCTEKKSLVDLFMQSKLCRESSTRRLKYTQGKLRSHTRRKITFFFLLLSRNLLTKLTI